MTGGRLQVFNQHKQIERDISKVTVETFFTCQSFFFIFVWPQKYHLVS